jgi:hypothetical protein
MFCEEFEGYDTRPTDPAARRTPTHVRSETSAASVGPTSTLKGLCVSCAKRDTCTFPKPEGGVWHCDEFE